MNKKHIIFTLSIIFCARHAFSSDVTIDGKKIIDYGDEGHIKLLEEKTFLDKNGNSYSCKNVKHCYVEENGKIKSCTSMTIHDEKNNLVTDGEIKNSIETYGKFHLGNNSLALIKNNNGEPVYVYNPETKTIRPEDMNIIKETKNAEFDLCKTYYDNQNIISVSLKNNIEQPLLSQEKKEELKKYKNIELCSLPKN